MNEDHPLDDSARAVQSGPEYRVLVLLVMLCLLAIPVAMQFPWPLSMAGYVLAIAANCYYLRKVLWGIQISGDTVSVSFPFSRKATTSFLITEIDRVRCIKNPIRIFAYTDFIWLFLSDGRKLALPRIGTNNFRSVENSFRMIGIENDHVSTSDK